MLFMILLVYPLHFSVIRLLFLRFFINNCETKNQILYNIVIVHCPKVQVGKDQEKAQSEKDSHSKNRGGKKPN